MTGGRGAALTGGVEVMLGTDAQLFAGELPNRARHASGVGVYVNSSGQHVPVGEELLERCMTT